MGLVQRMFYTHQPLSVRGFGRLLKFEREKREGSIGPRNRGLKVVNRLRESGLALIPPLSEGHLRRRGWSNRCLAHANYCQRGCKWLTKKTGC